MAIRVHMKKLSLPRLIRVVSSSLLLAYLVATSIMPTASAQSAPTTVGALTLVPTFKCISVYAGFSGDSGADNSAVLQYKKSSDTAWETAMQLVVDRRPQLYSHDEGTSPFANPFYNMWMGSIVGLTSNTSYDVRVTFTDADGVIGTNPVTGTVSTRNETIPVGTPARYVAPAASGGSNSNDGSLAHPWLTITYGLAHITAGQTLYVKAGTYNEVNLSIPTGTDWNHLTSIINYGTDTVIINGDSSNNPFEMTGKSYFRIKGFTIKNGGSASIELHDCHHFLIENCSVGDAHCTQGYMGLITAVDRSSDGIMRYITVFNTFAFADPGAGGYELAAIRVDDSNGQWIIHDVTYTAAADRPYFFDFIGNANSWNFHGGFYRDSDIYNVYLDGGIGSGSNQWDNAIELKTAAVNVRVFDNTFNNTGDCPISVTPIMVGPCYIFRNVGMHNHGSSNTPVFKCGSNGDEEHRPGTTENESRGYLFAYHNTFDGYGMAYANWSGGQPVWTNHTYINNIFTNLVLRAFILDKINYEVDPFVGDYNNYGPSPISILYNGNAYSSIAAYRTANGNQYEVHGQDSNPLLVSPSTGNFALQSSSPCRNAGKIIQGFNDSTGPYPYSGSAPDIGALEYNEGGPTPTPSPTPTSTPTPTGSPTSTPTPTPTPSPTSTSTPTPTPSCTGTFGDTNVHSSSAANSGAIDAYQANLSQAVNVTSMSIYIPSHSGSNTVRMAIYSDTSGSPGTLLAETSSVTAATGWNVLSIGPVSLNAGTYWLALQMSGADTFAYDTGSSGVNVWRAYTYGAFPSSFGSSESGSWYGSIYASYTCPSGSPTPTPTYTSTPTPTPTYIAGDANGDGSVNSLDITKVKRIIMELDSSTPGADANSDGAVNAIDITRIEQIILGQ